MRKPKSPRAGNRRPWDTASNHRRQNLTKTLITIPRYPVLLLPIATSRDHMTQSLRPSNPMRLAQVVLEQLVLHVQPPKAATNQGSKLGCYRWPNGVEIREAVRRKDC
jgi:hypothetical protein